MKKILIIHTGGTISMLENKETGEVNSTSQHPLANIAKHLDFPIDVNEHILFDLPSPHITPTHMHELAKKINWALSNYDGVVVTHGTDTLEETAYFLDLVIDTKKPIIITGAMRSSNEIGSDALYNLITSIRVASEDQSWEKGVLVVMNDEIHPAETVTKTSTSNVATFQSPQFGPIGMITKDSIVFHRNNLIRKKLPITELRSNVFLIKAYAGMDNLFMNAIYNAKPDGIVVEGLGQGNLPKQTIPVLEQINNAKIPVVLVSRSFKGYVQPTYGYAGGGKQLKEMGIIFGNGLSGPKARIKLMIALEHTKDLKRLAEIFANE
ncbi:asparaginase [Oceanobacillus piezotolerans]|uniref:asparaginase n=1 Tax=Oceanobacillus piezotolerans TaxID=2448030 RepID=A0A498DDQ2_9BACI|nr:asparaginase [Oceanobacillus piezotolerans]RLL48186.1 asparaginase [Oceanobacillus piezotolerans]